MSASAASHDAERPSHRTGKWRLGEAPQFQPQKRGFSETLGFTGGGSMFLPKEDPRIVNSVQGFDPIDMQLWSSLQFYVRKDGGEPFKPKRHMTDYLTDEAIAAVEANRNRPFFMFLAYNAPHTPLQATREDYEALSHIRRRTGCTTSRPIRPSGSTWPPPIRRRWPN